jgi:hypothetical protein
MSYSNLYGGLGGSPATTPPPTQTASGGAVANTAGEGSAHVAWLGIVIALIIIRILYKAGAKVD